MHAFAKLTWIELKLFAREPFAVIFTIVFPVIVLVVLVGSFEADDPAFGGSRPSDYYLASYVGVVIAAVGLIAVPVHIATYFERGIFQRFRASSLPVWTTVGSQVVVGLVMAIVGSAILILIGKVFYDARLPESPAMMFAGFLISTLSFLGLGMLIAVVTRTARAAQAVGLMLFFPMFLLGGAGPPPDAMSSGMRRVSDFIPLTFVVRSLQDPWFGRGMDWTNPAILVAVLAVALVLSLRMFRSV